MFILTEYLIYYIWDPDDVTLLRIKWKKKSLKKALQIKSTEIMLAELYFSNMLLFCAVALQQ